MYVQRTWIAQLDFYKVSRFAELCGKAKTRRQWARLYDLADHMTNDMSDVCLRIHSASFAAWSNVFDMVERAHDWCADLHERIDELETENQLLRN